MDGTPSKANVRFFFTDESPEENGRHFPPVSPEGASLETLRDGEEKEVFVDKIAAVGDDDGSGLRQRMAENSSPRCYKVFSYDSAPLNSFIEINEMSEPKIDFQEGSLGQKNRYTIQGVTSKQEN